MRKSKNRYFYHILVSPGDAPGAITLNVVWIEREFNAYKLSRCMCPSKYNRFWDTAWYSWKNRQFFVPLVFDAIIPVGVSTPPFGMEKLEWCRYPMVKVFISYLVWNFHSNWLLFLRVMQENKSGCFFLNTVYSGKKAFMSYSFCHIYQMTWEIAFISCGCW